MNTVITILFGVLLVSILLSIRAVAAPHSYGAINIPRLLKSISAVENTPQSVIGPAGERSEYQITRDVWFAYQHLPFEYASRVDDQGIYLAYATAAHHIEWIRARLHELNYRDDPYHIALVWKAGFTRCLQKRTRFVDVEYAKRVKNVYEDSSQ